MKQLEIYISLTVQGQAGYLTSLSLIKTNKQKKKDNFSKGREGKENKEKGKKRKKEEG